MTPSPRRVLLVEDEAMSRSFLAGMLRGAGFAVDEAASAVTALRAFTAGRPDAVVVDIDLGDGPSGLDLAVSLRRRSRDLPVVILSNYVVAPHHRHRMLSRVAYLRKRDLGHPEQVLSVLDGLIRTGTVSEAYAPSLGGRLEALTDAQAEVLAMVAVGLSNEEIAHRRATSVKSVEHMVHRVFAALGLTPDPSINSRVSAARVYLRETGGSGRAWRTERE